MTRLEFELTEQEAEIAASRAAWRASLSGGLLAQHLAPLAAFMLAVLFAAILGWTGLVSRRAAEIALIAAAAIYMGYRLWTRRRFLSQRRAALVWAETQRTPARLTLDETGFRITAAGREGTWAFADGLEVEMVAGMVYVWPRRGWPLVWPSRAHGGDTEAAEVLAYARSRAGMQAPAPSVVDDDD